MNSKMKKYKNITLSMLVAAVLASGLSGCFFGGGNDMNSGTSSANDSFVSSAPTLQTGENTLSGVSAPTENRTTVELLRENIARAYNDNYLPNMEIPEGDLETQFG
ncbi:MAG: hypothetical protein IKT78_01990, partial [Ruminiclostridium sp.]|nr:hypothetical protein [Ruminiclostridium sp.]